MTRPAIVYHDEAIVVINKPAGWVVHAGAGEVGETVADWYVSEFPEVQEAIWPEPDRIGIVHRLDKDTSGVMVLAKSPEILKTLQQQFKDRAVKKTYRALVFGSPPEAKGHIETYLGRHPQRRQEQTVLPIAHGDAARRLAVTDYVVIRALFVEDLPISLMTFSPQTGRMHQLRVQAKYLGTPILGDPVYTIKPAKQFSREHDITRQFLHASSLTFHHPITSASLIVTVPMPADMQDWLSRNQN